ncbi:cysteine desulfurase family protein [Acinetobacter baumannii]|nr:cysteine desulfurase family protein [Acinetobacter baumannii]
MIYLDFAASTPLLPSVRKVLFDSFDNDFSNPSSAHKLGISSYEKIEEVREIIANSINAYKSEIIFTSGASEANNLAIKGYVLGNKKKGKHIVTSSIEHKCILNIMNFLQKEYNYEITYISPKSNGVIDAYEVISALRPDTILVSIMHVNNELGSIQPIREIGEMCFKKNIKFHVDAAQSFKKISIDVDEFNIDFLSISAHKIYGPKGIGALYIRDIRETNIQPLIHGANQEFGFRGGSLATPLIMGFGAAVQDQTIENNIYKIREMNNYLRSQIVERGGKINSPFNNNIPHILNIFLPTLNSSKFIANSSFLCSQSSACSSHNIEPSYVLQQIGLDVNSIFSSLRISLDYNINHKILNNFIKELFDSIN